LPNLFSRLASTSQIKSFRRVFSCITVATRKRKWLGVPANIKILLKCKRESSLMSGRSVYCGGCVSRSCDTPVSTRYGSICLSKAPTYCSTTKKICEVGKRLYQAIHRDSNCHRGRKASSSFPALIVDRAYRNSSKNVQGKARCRSEIGKWHPSCFVNRKLAYMSFVSRSGFLASGTRFQFVNCEADVIKANKPPANGVFMQNTKVKKIE